jgi:proteasome accessory factor B
MDKIERLINLTACLLDTSRPVTFEELGRTVYHDQPSRTTSEMSALHKMFERDKEELRDMGIEVEARKAERGREEGYIIPRRKYYLPHLDLLPEEAVALTLVSRLFLGSGTPFSGPAHSALLKLAFEGGTVEDVPHVYWVESPSDREALGSIVDALVRRKFLKFSYRALDASEPMAREVAPYGLFNWHGSWYMVGLCHFRDETRCFKLDRIVSKVEVNASRPRTADFEVPKGFNIQKEAWWEWPPPREAEDIEACVAFKPRLAFARESGPARVIGEDRKKDGSLEVTFEVADPEQFIEWVLGFGTDARVVSPAELREMVVERLAGVLKGMKKK